MSKPIFLQNKKICDKVRSVRDMLSKKMGKEVAISETVKFMFDDEEILNKIQNSEVTKKPRRKKEYVFKI